MSRCEEEREDADVTKSKQERGNDKQLAGKKSELEGEQVRTEEEKERVGRKDKK